MQATTDLIALHGQATETARRVVDGVRPEQLGDPTPCTEWDTREVLNHIVGLHLAVAAAGGVREMPEWGADFVGDDPRRVFADAAAAAESVFRAPGALERTFEMPWGEMGGTMLANVAFLDVAIHTWDLAKATGQLALLDPDLCETALGMGRVMLTEEYRSVEHGFAPEVAVPNDAPACDRLAGFYGRRP